MAEFTLNCPVTSPINRIPAPNPNAVRTFQQARDACSEAKRIKRYAQSIRDENLEFRAEATEAAILTDAAHTLAPNANAAGNQAILQAIQNLQTNINNNHREVMYEIQLSRVQAKNSHLTHEENLVTMPPRLVPPAPNADPYRRRNNAAITRQWLRTANDGTLNSIIAYYGLHAAEDTEEAKRRTVFEHIGMRM